MAVALEIRMCSKRNAPTGMIPLRECSRRRTKEMPWPARNGATPCATGFTAGAEGLATDATSAPYEFSSTDTFSNEKRTFYYRGTGEVKSRLGSVQFEKRGRSF